MNEHFFPKDSFIGGWYIPEKLCDDLISDFHSSKKQGLTKPGVQYFQSKVFIDKDQKDSEDLTIHHKHFNKPYDSYRAELQKCLEKYIKKYTQADCIDPYNVNENYTLQYYPIGGGFKKWHSERGKLKPYRVLVFMTYLNDVDDGGTEFFNQNLTSPAKKGLTLIWPTDWTHTHRGQISHTKEKYIVTGWFSFNE